MISIPHSGKAGQNDLKDIKEAYGSIPEEYTEFLKNHDGACLPPNFIDGTGGMASIRRFITAVEILSIWKRVDGLESRFLPIAEDGSGNLICLDHYGALVFWDHEIEKAPIKIASSLLALIKLIRPINELDFKGNPEIDKVWTRPGSKLFDKKNRLFRT